MVVPFCVEGSCQRRGAGGGTPPWAAPAAPAARADQGGPVARGGPRAPRRPGGGGGGGRGGRPPPRVRMRVGEQAAVHHERGRDHRPGRAVRGSPVLRVVL